MSGSRKNVPTLNRASLALDESGAVYTEYVIVLSVVALGGAASIATLGVPLLRSFLYLNMMILLPIP